MKTHVELVGLINIVSGLVSVLIGLFILALFLILAPVTGDPTGSFVLVAVGMSVGGLLIVLGLPGLVAGIGLLKFRAWARILALIAAILAFFNFPLGTLVAVYTVWVLTNDEAVKLLDARA